MIVLKAREKSHDVLQLEALCKRLSQRHASYERVFADLKKALRGLKGEKAVTFPLDFIKKEQSVVLHNLRIPDQNGAFQMDTLIVAQNYLLILEIKNWYGTLLFDENGQVIRVDDDGREEGFPSPLLQVKLQRHRLQHWLQAQGLPASPILYLVIISHPSTIIKPRTSTHPIPKHVIHNNELPFTIHTLDETFTNQVMTPEQIKCCSTALLEAHTPQKKNVLTLYDVSETALITGVFCPKCSRTRMRRHLQKWYCRNCNHFSENAHYDALNDYHLLIGDYISNREARRFLHLNSPYVTKHILQKAGFLKKGETSATTYQLELRDIPNT